MKRTSWLITILIAIVCLSMIFFGTIATISSQPHSHYVQNIASLPPLLADGAINPSAIPDLIAYEILFNSVADGSNANELERQRAKYFAEKTLLSSSNINLLRLSANRFGVSVSAIDAQAADLKNRHWPKPDQSVLGQLSVLQKQKEAILSAAIDSFIGQLSDSDREKINARILDIKSKVKVYKDIPIEAYQR